MMKNIPASVRDVRVLTGEADIDVSEAVYTAYVALLTIAPATGSPLEDCVVVIDLDKDTTGFADAYTTGTIRFIVQRKIDGTNWRGDFTTQTAALAGDNADGLSYQFNIGPVGVTQQVRIAVLLSAEGTDVEFPYAVYFKASKTPTVTAVAAA